MSADRADGLRPTRKERRLQAREERRAAEAAERRAAARRRRALAGGAAILLLGVAAAAWILSTDQEAPTAARVAAQTLELSPLRSLGPLRGPGPAGPLGPEEVPIPAAPAAASTTMATGEPVDGIECSTGEQTLFHIHAHLTLFVHGAAKQVPYGIGIPGDRVENTPSGQFVGSGRCFYWLHTHAADGIIHIESPVERAFTLGQFFDIWGEALGPGRVGPWRGHVTAIYNGARFEADPREIPLAAHAQIQLEVGRPLVAPETIRFPEGL